MFYDVYLELCKKKKVSPTRAAIEIGLSKSTPTTWKQRGLTPQGDTLSKIADYFNVTVDYLLGTEQQKKAPTLTKKDERDIARDLEKFIEDMDQSGDLMFDGDPMTPEARESIIAAMKLGLEAAKVRNKERFTPKKYRKKD